MIKTTKTISTGRTRVGLVALVVALTLVAWAGVGHSAAPAEPPVHTLIVDETHTITEALQLRTFARQLAETGRFELKGVNELSVEAPPPDPPYELIVVVPADVDQVWILTPDPPHRLSPRLRAAYERTEQIATQVYEEISERPRAVVDISEDVLAAYYGRLFETQGWLSAGGSRD